MLKDIQEKPGLEVLPKYKKARSYILEKVNTGKWIDGKPLPSEIALSKELGVARSTVRQALDELAAENIIQKIQGRGTFLSSTKPHQSKQQMNAFGIIVPELHRSTYPCLLKGFDEGANQSYRKMIVSHTDFDLGRQADIILQMLNSNIAGVAIVPSISTETPVHQIEVLQKNNVPVVFCFRGVRGTFAPLITFDFELAGTLCAREFIKRGHKNVAYFACYDYEATRALEQGFRKELKENNLILCDDLIHFGTKLGENQEEIKKEVLIRMLNSKHRPTAIFCNDDTEAESIYLVSQQIGIKVPEELSIVGTGVNRREGYMKKCLSSITFDAFEGGKKAASLLEEMCSGKRPIAQSCRVLMPLEMWPGQTLAQR